MAKDSLLYPKRNKGSKLEYLLKKEMLREKIIIVFNTWMIIVLKSTPSCLYVCTAEEYNQ